jgi:hypothetical protein
MLFFVRAGGLFKKSKKHFYKIGVAERNWQVLKDI